LKAVAGAQRVSITGGFLSPPFRKACVRSFAGASFQLPEGLSALRSPSDVGERPVHSGFNYRRASQPSSGRAPARVVRAVSITGGPLSPPFRANASLEQRGSDVSITGGPLSPPFERSSSTSAVARTGFNYRRASQPSVHLITKLSDVHYDEFQLPEGLSALRSLMAALVDKT